MSEQGEHLLHSFSYLMRINSAAAGTSEEVDDDQSRYDRETAIFQRLLDMGGNPFCRSTDPLPGADMERWSEQAIQTVTFDSLYQMSEAERNDLAYNQVRIGAMRRIADGIHHQCVKCFDHIPIRQLEVTPFRDRCAACLAAMG